MNASTIPTRPLGRSGIDVTEIGIGLWAVGGHWGPLDDAQALDAIDAALDSGVNYFDTADVYGSGHSEKLLGKAMDGRRDRFVVGTKLGWLGYDSEKGQTQYTTVEKLIAGVESNLQRLDTDYVDLIQCHIWHDEPTTDVFIEGFQKLKEQGKIRAFGCSTSGLELTKKFAQAGADSLQIDYSILNRDPENEVLPYCKEHGVGVIVRGPLAMGILSGKFSADYKFNDTDFRKAWVDDPEQNEQYLKDLEMVERLGPLANEQRSLAQTALKFVLAHDAVTTVIPGGRTRGQAESNAAAGLMKPLSAIELSLITSVVPSGGGRKIWPAEG